MSATRNVMMQATDAAAWMAGASKVSARAGWRSPPDVNEILSSLFRVMLSKPAAPMAFGLRARTGDGVAEAGLR